MFETVLALAQKILPLYLYIILGFVAGRKLRVEKEHIANVLVYLILPVIVFHGAATADIEPGLFLLPVIMFVLASVVCLVTYWIARKVWSDGTSNLLAFVAGTGNTGYFGLPVAAALFGNQSVSIMVFGTLGMVLYETTIGYYLIARGQFTGRQALQKMLRLPLIYAFIIGLVFNRLVGDFSPAYIDLVAQFRGAYTVLGMMVIGLGLAGITSWKVDWKFVTSALSIKFLVWPLLVLGVILLDNQLFNWFPRDIAQVLVLLALVPHAVNSINFATILKVHPEKAALVVSISTTVALLYIPLVLALFGLV